MSQIMPNLVEARDVSPFQEGANWILYNMDKSYVYERWCNKNRTCGCGDSHCGPNWTSQCNPAAMCGVDFTSGDDQV